MSFSKDDIAKLVEAGAAISADATGMTKDDLVEIAALAHKVDTVVTFKNVGGLSVDDLLAVVAEGGEAVSLDL